MGPGDLILALLDKLAMNILTLLQPIWFLLELKYVIFSPLIFVPVCMCVCVPLKPYRPLSELGVVTVELLSRVRSSITHEL